MADAYEFDLHALKRPPPARGKVASPPAPASPPQVPVTDLPAQAKVTVLLGESGSGKTTTLWRIALDHAHRWLGGQTSYAPVLVDLKHWTPDTPIRHLIARAFTHVNADQDAVNALLQGGQLLLLLDGLNELPASPAERGQAQRDIHAFFQGLGEHRVVVSCRTPDFEPAFIAADQEHPPVTYETARLSAAQVHDYVIRRFPGDHDCAQALLTQLRIDDRALWDNAASFVHLARLPLHLQLLVEDFMATGEVPRNKGTLLQRLIRRMGRTAVTRRAPYLDDHTRESVLSTVAHRGVTSQRYLTLPVTVARQGVADGLTALIQTHELPSDANVAAVWTDLLSDNYLTFTRVEGESAVSRDRNEVQWLHQTVFDYSLAQTLIRAVQLLGPGDQALPAPLDKWLATLPEILDQPCQIALGLLPQQERVVLLDQLVRQRNSLAGRVLVGEEPAAADLLIVESLELVLQDDPRVLTDLRHVALLRPSVGVATRLIEVFRYRSVEEKREIVRVNCAFAIKYQDTPAARRALRSAHTWLGNRDEWVKFYAAQAAWGGPQRGEAGQVLQQLRQARDPDVRRAVATLAKSWGA
nr:NACHT domain-containing protein [Deinococcus aestuarii]